MVSRAHCVCICSPVLCLPLPSIHSPPSAQPPRTEGSPSSVLPGSSALVTPQHEQDTPLPAAALSPREASLGIEVTPCAWT